MAKTNVIDLAKSGKKTTTKSKTAANKKTTAKSKTAANKKTTVKKEEPVLTPEQERDLKAKAKVEELLKDSSLKELTKKEDETFELEEQKSEVKGVDWLEEQITILTQKNLELTDKMEEVKIDFEKILKENQDLKSGNFSGGDGVKKQVIILFNELQENYIRMGPNFMVYFPAFLNRMVKFFPFLNEIKKY